MQQRNMNVKFNISSITKRKRSLNGKNRIMKVNRTNSSDPHEHIANIKAEFSDLIQHLREDIGKVDDPKAKALFETSAEVISGLEKAFSDYENATEDAWKK